MLFQIIINYCVNQEEAVIQKEVALLKTKKVNHMTTKRAHLITANDTAAENSSYKSNTLAPVQRQTLEFLRNFIADKGFAPTLKDIAQHIGVKSASTAHFHLERLESKGFIRRGPDGFLELVEVSTPQLGPTAVPLVGVIAAGVPIEAIEQSTMIDIPSSMIGAGGQGEVYCLEVSGESMIDAHICDGDVVVIKKQDLADNGQIVVALLSDGSATLKTYRRLKSGKVMLMPANPAIAPITVDDVTVQGRVIGIIRELN
ncbi:transcriptional repressor LexA [Oligoflexia bacterium]|nr:transcriptional repressor LexA [Oligoflexia bacterium]